MQAGEIRSGMLLREGGSLKMIAIEVGCGTEAALSRAFKLQSGMTPREWQQGQA